MGSISSLLKNQQDGASPAPRTILQNATVPTDSDARAARSSGIGIGTSYEPYLSPDKQFVDPSGAKSSMDSIAKRILLKPSIPDGYGTTNINPDTSLLGAKADLRDPTVSTTQSSDQFLEFANNAKFDDSKLPKARVNEFVKNHLAKGAIMASKNPIASLGFDPKNIIIDMSGKDYTVAGVYNPNTGKTLTNPRTVSNIVHESIHAGLQKIIPIYESSGKKLPSNIWGNDTEEMIVRRIMDKTFDGVEELAGSEGKKQVLKSRELARFIDPIVSDLQKIAATQDLMATKYGRK